MCLWTDHPDPDCAERLREWGLDHLAEALARPARRSLFVAGPTCGDGEAPIREVATIELYPSRALRVLAQLAEVTGGGRASSGQAAWSPAGAHHAIGGDLLFWARMVAGLQQIVDAGRVVPLLYHHQESWWARWQALPDTPIQRWLAKMAGAAPAAVLSQRLPLIPHPHLDGRQDPRDWRPAFGSATAALADANRELTDQLVRPRVASVSLGMNPAHLRSPLLSWLIALETGEPIAGWPDERLRELADRLASWRASSFTAPFELLLRLADPYQRETDDRGEDSPPSWRLELRLRSVADPTVVVDAEHARNLPEAPVDPHALIGAELAKAAVSYPPLTEWADQGAGDIELTAAQAVDLVTVGAPALTAAGFAVQVPRRWTRPELTLRVQARAENPAAPNGSAGMGMQQIVQYSWQAALGEDQLTAEELTALAKAKEPLVRLRGQWVQVDPDVVDKTLRFLSGHDGAAGTGQLDEADAAEPLELTTRTDLADLFAVFTGAKDVPVPIVGIEGEGWLGDLLAGVGPATDVPSPAGLKTELRPYQQRGLSWLAYMSQLGLGVVLADDMGLGKTVQLLALLLHEQDEGRQCGPTLLVCPMSVVGNWQREAERFAPQLRSYVHHGPGRRTGEAFARAVADADLVITTYALLARDAASLAQVRWQRVTLDEAQHVKNSQTAQARAARTLAAEHRVALTGTPMENRLDELRALVDFVNPGLLGSAASFRKRFAVPIERHHDVDAARRLTAVTRPFILRREKTDPQVISDLPDKMEMTARANLTAEQASLYQAVVDDMLHRIDQVSGIGRKGLVLATLTKLKQICNHPAHFLGDSSPVLNRGKHRSGKLALAEDIIDAAVSDGERVLCFTQYREFGELLAPYLSERFEVPVPFFHGGLSARRREEVLNDFQSESGPPILLLSLKAGGTGVNLTAASQVIHLDRWWNPAVEDQATDRAYRIGQRRRVQVRKMLCVGTIEERIDTMIQAKRELATMVVGAGENWLTELDTEQLRELVSLSADAVGE